MVSGSHLESKKNVCQLERAEDTAPVFNIDSKLAKYVYNQAKQTERSQINEPLPENYDRLGSIQ